MNVVAYFLSIPQDVRAYPLSTKFVSKSLLSQWLALACALLWLLGPFAGRALAQNDAKLAPLAVLPIPPASKAQLVPQNLAFANLLGEKLCAALKDKGLPSRAFPLDLDPKQEDNPDALRRIAGRNKVARLLRPKITQLDFEIRDNGFGWLARASITMNAELVDANTGQVLKTYSGHGLRSVRITTPNGQAPQGNAFIADANGETYAMNAANECLYGDGKKYAGLAALIAKDYPDSPWQIPGGVNVVAELQVNVKADSKEKAAALGVEQIFYKVVPTPSEMQKFHLEKRLLPNAPNLVTVTEGTEKGLFLVKASIDDVQSDRPGLMHELKQLGDLQLAVIGVVASDPTLQNDLQTALAKAGFDVRDEQRLGVLRNRSYVENMLDGKADPIALQSLKDAANAFAFLIFADGLAENKGMRNGVYSVLARVRVKIMDPNTAALLPGADESESDEDETPRAASERAIKSAAALVKPQMLQELYKHLSPQTGTTIINIEISGWKKIGDAERFRADLAKVPGVIAAEKQTFESAILTLKVELSKEARKTLAVALEEDANLKKYGISVSEDKKDSIRAKRDLDQAIGSADTVTPDKTVKQPTGGGTGKGPSGTGTGKTPPSGKTGTGKGNGKG